MLDLRPTKESNVGVPSSDGAENRNTDYLYVAPSAQQDPLVHSGPFWRSRGAFLAPHINTRIGKWLTFVFGFYRRQYPQIRSAIVIPSIRERVRKPVRCSKRIPMCRHGWTVECRQKLKTSGSKHRIVFGTPVTAWCQQKALLDVCALNAMMYFVHSWITTKYFEAMSKDYSHAITT